MADKQTWGAIVYHRALDTGTLNRTLDAITASDEIAPEALLVVLPRLSTAEDIADLISHLCASERWGWEQIDNVEDNKLLVGLRWQMASGRSASWVLGFADLPSMPFTRRSPFVALAMRTKESPREYPEPYLDFLHLADLPADAICPGEGEFDRTWRSTEAWKCELLNDELEHAARARITFALPAHCQQRIAVEPTHYRWGSQKVFTIGYEGRSAEELLGRLEEKKVQVLVDARLRPNSRKQGFAKSALKAACEERGIGYVHDVELGTPKDMLDRVKASGGYADSEVVAYREHLLNEKPEALDRAVEQAAGNTVCFLCYEHDPSDCHRRVIAEEVSKRLGGIKIKHL